MRPWLVIGLVASLALSGLAAWWPTPDDPSDLLPGVPTRGRPADAPQTQAATGSARAPVLNPPPRAAATAATALTSPAAAPAAPATALPTRAADWPEPGAAALAAWQGALVAAAGASAAARPSASASSAEPPAPVFPYQWIGQLDDGGPPQVLLASAQRSVAVRRGAVLDSRWRLDRAAGEPWKATHLPSGRVVSVRGSPVAGEP
jgi:hypothetical protein